MDRITLRVIDSNIRRRAEITSLLSGQWVLVDPYESVDELNSYWPSEGTLLVHDERSALDDLVIAMTEAGKWLPIVAYSEDPSVEKAVSALSLGVLDYIVWPIEREAMLARLADVEKRSRTLGQKQRDIAEAKARVRSLSGREQQVLADFAHGLSNKEIAQHLGISPRTVEIHRANLIGKIGAKSSAHAIRIAILGDL